MPYTIEEHRHRFAAWAAGRAANVKGCHFTVEQAKSILEATGFNQLLSAPESLPEPQDVDTRHRLWRNNIIANAQSLGLTFTHGVAAKLINIYLKAGFICGGHHNNEKVQALHPPIDSLLLKELSSQNIGGLQQAWNEACMIRWSKFDSSQYETVIRNIRSSIPNQPLWTIEQYWRGFQ